MIQVSIEVNGKTVTAEVEPRLTLLDFIRDVAGLKGTHAGCEHGVCGACTVLVEGNAIRSCLVLAVQADEQEVISIEGVGGDLGRSGELSIVQDAFCEAHGLQCGYCTPGMVLVAEALLADTPNPTEGEYTRGHFRQHLPLHWLCADCRSSDVGSRSSCEPQL